MKEADISISGVTLTEAQSMTVRVAVQSFALFLLGGDARRQLGEGLREGYARNVEEINKLLARTTA